MRRERPAVRDRDAGQEGGTFVCAAGVGRSDSGRRRTGGRPAAVAPVCAEGDMGKAGGRQAHRRSLYGGRRRRGRDRENGAGRLRAVDAGAEGRGAASLPASRHAGRRAGGHARAQPHSRRPAAARNHQSFLQSQDPAPGDGLLQTLQGAAQAGSDARATVEVAHEALIQRWPTLRDWVAREPRKTAGAGGDPARQGGMGGERQDEKFLLDPGVQLERGRALLDNPGDVPVDDIRDYVGRSIEKDQRRLDARSGKPPGGSEAHRRCAETHSASRSRGLVVALLVAAAAVWQYFKATEATRIAEQASQCKPRLTPSRQSQFARGADRTGSRRQGEGGRPGQCRSGKELARSRQRPICARRRSRNRGSWPIWRARSARQVMPGPRSCSRSRRCPTPPPGLLDPMSPRRSCSSTAPGAICASGSFWATRRGVERGVQPRRQAHRHRV